MRAIVCHTFGPYQDLHAQPFAPPELAPQSVLIDVHAAGLSFAISLFVSGRYQRKPPRPFVPGTEAAGVVRAVAPDVRRFRPGDRVVATLDWGGLAGIACAHEATVQPLSDGLDFAEATTFAASYPTSLAALTWRGRLQAGETLLVHGAAGGVGSAAVELGKALGARVIAVVSTKAKADHLEAISAPHDIIIAAEGGFYQQVRTLTQGRGADVIFEPVGGDVLTESLRCIAPGGRLLTIGYAGGTIPQVPANILLVKNASVMGFALGEYVGWGLTDERKRYAADMAALHERLRGWFEAGVLHPHVSHRYGLEGFVEGMDAIFAREVRGKAVIEMRTSDRA
ncbi:MAG: NADPH:quinone oxidoreductase family protein [Pseudomonadota bacterium]